MSSVAKLSVAEYERIAATGVFDWPKKRHIELIRGQLREQGRIAPDHAEVVCRLGELSFRYVLDDVIRIRVQNPLAFADVDSEPEPDFAWVREKDYWHAHPTAADALLVIEVAGPTLEYDRTEKADLYAEVGIQDYWIVNIVERTIEVRRDPESGHYRTVQIFAGAEIAHPLAVPEAAISFDKLLAAS